MLLGFQIWKSTGNVGMATCAQHSEGQNKQCAAIHISTYIYNYIYTHTHTYMHIYTYTCMSIYRHMCMYIYIYIYVYTCVYLYASIHIYIHIYTYVSDVSIHMYLFTCLYIYRKRESLFRALGSPRAAACWLSLRVFQRRPARLQAHRDLLRQLAPAVEANFSLTSASRDRAPSRRPPDIHAYVYIYICIDMYLHL